VVLDAVLGAAGQVCRDAGPSVAQLSVRVDQQQLLRIAPLAAVDARRQVVVPALAALLGSARQ